MLFSSAINKINAILTAINIFQKNATLLLVLFLLLCYFAILCYLLSCAIFAIVLFCYL